MYKNFLYVIAIQILGFMEGVSSCGPSKPVQTYIVGCQKCVSSHQCDYYRYPECLGVFGSCGCRDNYPGDCPIDYPACDFEEDPPECEQCVEGEDCQNYYNLNGCYENKCVVCTEDADCTSYYGSLTEVYCDTTPGPANYKNWKCAECVRNNNECQNPEAPMCVDDFCVPCWDNSNCQHLNLNLCVDFVCLNCTNNKECPNNEYCNPQGNCTLKQCMSDSDCISSLQGEICSQSNFTCGKCTRDLDCTFNPSIPYCQFNMGKCVACLYNQDCPLISDQHFCQQSNFTCAGCITNSECQGEFGSEEEFCQQSSGKCVSCLNQIECTIENPLCNVNGTCQFCLAHADCAQFTNYSKHYCLNELCVECLKNSECIVGLPICDNAEPNSQQEYICRKCNSGDTSCSAFNSALPYCNTENGECVGCRTNSDCTSPDLPICNSNGVCSGCSSNAECTAKFARNNEIYSCNSSLMCVLCPAGCSICVNPSVCSHCDATFNRENGECVCPAGYSVNKQGECAEVCGDSKRRTNQTGYCDIGGPYFNNLLGCNDCKVVDGWTCSGGNTTSPDVCQQKNNISFGQYESNSTCTIAWLNFSQPVNQSQAEQIAEELDIVIPGTQATIALVNDFDGNQTDYQVFLNYKFGETPTIPEQLQANLSAQICLIYNCSQTGFVSIPLPNNEELVVNLATGVAIVVNGFTPLLKTEYSLATSAIAVASIIGNSNPVTLWLMVDLMQQFFYISLINVEFQDNVEAFWQIFSGNIFTFISNPFDYSKVINIEDQLLGAPPKFLAVGFDDLFVFSTAWPLFTTGMAFLIYFVFKYTDKYIRRLPSISRRIMKKFTEDFIWSGAIRAWLVNLSLFNFIITLQLYYSVLDNAIHRFSVFCAIGMIFVHITMIIICGLVLYRNRFDREWVKLKYKTLVQEVIIENDVGYYYPLFDIARKCIVPIALVLCYNLPYFQVMPMMALSVTNFFLVLFYDIYEEDLTRYQVLIEEVGFTSIFVIIFIMIVNVDSPDFYYTLGWGIIASCSLVITITMVLVMIKQFELLKFLCKFFKKMMKAGSAEAEKRVIEEETSPIGKRMFRRPNRAKIFARKNLHFHAENPNGEFLDDIGMLSDVRTATTRDGPGSYSLRRPIRPQNALNTEEDSGRVDTEGALIPETGASTDERRILIGSRPVSRTSSRPSSQESSRSSRPGSRERTRADVALNPWAPDEPIPESKDENAEEGIDENQEDNPEENPVEDDEGGDHDRYSTERGERNGVEETKEEFMGLKIEQMIPEDDHLTQENKNFIPENYSNMETLSVSSKQKSQLNSKRTSKADSDLSSTVGGVRKRHFRRPEKAKGSSVYDTLSERNDDLEDLIDVSQPMQRENDNE